MTIDWKSNETPKEVLSRYLRFFQWILLVLLVVYCCGVIELPWMRSYYLALKDLDKYTSSKAKRKLAEGGEALLPYLKDMVKHKNWRVRWQIPYYLREIDTPASYKLLVEMLQDPDWRVLYRVGRSIPWGRKALRKYLPALLSGGNIESKRRILEWFVPDYRSFLEDRFEWRYKEHWPTNFILPLLKDDSPVIRRQALYTLGELGDKRSMKDIAPLLKDKDKTIRAEAARALGRLRGKGLEKPLLDALKDPHWRVRMEAVASLEYVGGPEVVEPLVSCLEDENWRVRYRTVTALGGLGHPGATFPLMAYFKKQKDLKIKKLILYQLGKIADPRSAQFISDALHENRDAFGIPVSFALKEITRGHLALAKSLAIFPHLPGTFGYKGEE